LHFIVKSTGRLCIVFCLSLLPVSLLYSDSAWKSAPLEELNFSSYLGNVIDHAVEDGQLPNLHSVLIIRQNKIALEKYFPGKDEIWGTSIGEVEFDQSTLHDLRSITKSVVSLLYGIALDEGLVPSADTPILNSYTKYEKLANNTQLQAIKIHHVLSMTMGLEWNENLPYTDPANSEIAMENATDRYHYILSRNSLFPAGQQWQYSGGTTALLSNLITRGSGKGILKYAQEKLFDPLAIKAQWIKGFNREESAASGLRMRPRDLAKIGQLILNQGQWNGEQIVPKVWLDTSFDEHAEAGNGLHYGYQWWLGTMRKDGSRWISGFGNGSQRLVVIPSLEMVVVIMAGNYNQAEQWKLPVKLMSDYIIPAVED